MLDFWLDSGSESTLDLFFSLHEFFEFMESLNDSQVVVIKPLVLTLLTLACWHLLMDDVTKLFLLECVLVHKNESRNLK